MYFFPSLAASSPFLKSAIMNSIISYAASPTAVIVKAENAYGSIAPTKSPENCVGLRISTFLPYTLVTNAPNKARPTRQADPIAKPFPTAAVVFPAASRASVLSLTVDGRPLISAIPPALSEIGP